MLELQVWLILGLQLRQMLFQQWNPAKYAFATDAKGFLSYTLNRLG
jgi:hypothetical protein